VNWLPFIALKSFLPIFMRTIRRTARFKKDYKRELRGRHRATLEAIFGATVSLLATDSPLIVKLRDHPLTGQWKDCRDCHLKPDLVLVYRLPDEDTLELVRLGSHSELSL
jgi:mRNA interferase YafQ